MHSRFIKNNESGGSAHGKIYEKGSSQYDRGSDGGKRCHHIFCGGGAKRKFKKFAKNMTEAKADALKILSKTT